MSSSRGRPDSSGSIPPPGRRMAEPGLKPSWRFHSVGSKAGPPVGRRHPRRLEHDPAAGVGGRCRQGQLVVGERQQAAGAVEDAAARAPRLAAGQQEAVDVEDAARPAGCGRPSSRGRRGRRPGRGSGRRRRRPPGRAGRPTGRTPWRRPGPRVGAGLERSSQYSTAGLVGDCRPSTSVVERLDEPGGAGAALALVELVGGEQADELRSTVVVTGPDGGDRRTSRSVVGRRPAESRS